MTREPSARAGLPWSGALLLLGVLPLVAVAFVLRAHLPQVTDPRPFSGDPVTLPLWLFLALWPVGALMVTRRSSRTAPRPRPGPAQHRDEQGQLLWRTDHPLEQRVGVCRAVLEVVLSQPRSDWDSRLWAPVSVLYVAMEDDPDPALRSSVARALSLLLDETVRGAERLMDDSTARSCAVVRTRAAEVRDHSSGVGILEITELYPRLAAWAAEGR